MRAIARERAHRDRHPSGGAVAGQKPWGDDHLVRSAPPPEKLPLDEGTVMDCAPRFGTRRRAERKTLGPRVARIGGLLGTPFMPWQHHIADVGLEYTTTATGLIVPCYREIIVTVPRQNGKTTIVLSWYVDRALNWGKPQRSAYTAQTGQDARKKLLEDHVPMIERSPLKAAIDHVRRKNGEEGINWKGGSQLDVLASGSAAGHGRTLALGFVDEAFTDTDDRREQSMLPAMSTVADAQLFVCSTMGTDASMYLNRKIDAGRDVAMRDDDDSEIAYFEWSAPEELDIEDPATWRGCMPAYDITIGKRAVRHAFETMPEGEFRRAFLNQRTASEERVIPIDEWNAVQDETCKPDGLLFFSIDADPERTHASIGVADVEGRCELVEHHEGTGWLVSSVVSLAKRWNTKVAYDPAGPAGVFGDELEKHGVNTVKVAGQDMGHACSFFFDGVVEEKLRIRPHEALNAAVAAAARRVSGDAWTWARRHPQTDISPLVAVTIASWAVAYARKPLFIY